MLVFNLGGLMAGLLALGAALTASTYAPGWGDAGALAAGFATMAVVGAIFEWRAAPGQRPRYFWVLPAWCTGVTGAGIAVLLELHRIGGAILVAVGAIGFAGHVVQESRRPGGRWVIRMLIAALLFAADLVIEAGLLDGARPRWLVIAGSLMRVALIAVFLHAAYRRWRDRIGAATELTS